jgi:hypothetical protein
MKKVIINVIITVIPRLTYDIFDEILFLMMINGDATGTQQT